jgi:hypothetical protein
VNRSLGWAPAAGGSAGRRRRAVEGREGRFPSAPPKARLTAAGGVAGLSRGCRRNRSARGWAHAAEGAGGMIAPSPPSRKSLIKVTHPPPSCHR